MFQAARPALRWSIEANFRAMWKGSLYVVDAVAARPMCVVCTARADSSVSGSNWRKRPQRLNSSALRYGVRMPTPSATKNMSNLPRSAVRRSSR